MGHIQPGGAVAGPEAALTEDPLWPTWRALVHDFRFGRALWQLMTSSSAFGFYGLNVAESFLKQPAAQEARARLKDLPPGLLDQLAGIAAINARRSEALWKAAALFYITVPVTLTLAALQAIPEVLRQFLAGMPPSVGFGVAIGTLCAALQMLFYFGVHWRASQIAAVIDLVRLERQAPATPPAA